MQELINKRSDLINGEVSTKLGIDRDSLIEWLSPLQDDQFAEYSDGDFLERLNIPLDSDELSKFWPASGPNWDGLARIGSDKVLLIEAKAHIGEMISGPSSARNELSVDLIRSSLASVQSYCAAPSNLDWNGPVYQYANRVAHLYFLRNVHSINAHLGNVYFVNDREMGGPSTVDEWMGAIVLTKSLLGLRRHKLSAYMHDIFIDVSKLQ
ncbi:MAG: hypothetical protein P8Z76_08550 [Alphaproteobacteria bacterium]